MKRVEIRDIVLMVGLMWLGLTTSCIRDELAPCPPLQISLEVTDKNYRNIRGASRLGLEEMRSETLPFKAYVHNLSYRLTSIDSGEEVLVRTLSPVEGEAGQIQLTLPDDLPYGRYLFSAWGNVTEQNKPAEEEMATELHPGGEAGADLYYTVDTLTYALGSEQYTCGMKRLKGKLIVEVKNLPDSYRYAYNSVSDIQTHWSWSEGYSHPEEMCFREAWTQPGDQIYKRLMAPSEAEAASVVKVHFTEQPESADSGNWLAPEPVSVTLRRNELTVLRYDYDRCCCCFKVYILVNDNWETLHSMEID